MSNQAVLEPAPAGEAESSAGPAGTVPEQTTDSGRDEALIADELLVEEVSIDGMCGVY
jgi:mycofactocin precursor